MDILSPRLNERQYLARIEGRGNDTREGDLRTGVAISASSAFSNEVTVI
jgi:hypothetical protein